MAKREIGESSAFVRQVRQKTQDCVGVHDLQLRCEIGFNPHEIGKLQELLITVLASTSVYECAETDDVATGLDLKALAKGVLEAIEGKQFNLIEAVADDAARIALSFPVCDSVEVEVKKPGAIRFSHHSGCVVKRSRGDYEPLTVLVSGGSNIEPAKNIQEAVRLLGKYGEVTRASAVYMTPPVGEGSGSKEFVNFALELKTRLLPSSGMLKAAFRKIEAKLGRVRDPKNKNAPRPIDLDVACVQGGAVRHAGFDADIARFSHVAVPLADLAPDLSDSKAAGDSKPTLLDIARRLTGRDDPSSFFKKASFGVLLEASASSPAEKTQVAWKKPPTVSKSEGALVAVVTGGVSKLGTFICKALHADGYNVLVHCNGSLDAAKALVAEFERARAGSALVLQQDLADAENAARHLIEAAVAKWGRVDAIVNNASVWRKHALSAIDTSEFNLIQNVNVAAPLFLVLQALPYLEKCKGSVVNICDIHGERPDPGKVIYSMSKASLIAQTKGLAKELGPKGVRVNGVSPGAISWDATHTETAKKDILSKVAMQREGAPKDISDAVLFFLKGSYLTGQVLSVDGGRTLNQ